ncbi:MAG: RDD family protein [Dehalococcoidia bacterium]|nr:RDD family protein [Dehalococcoidia bacterium]
MFASEPRAAAARLTEVASRPLASFGLRAAGLAIDLATIWVGLIVIVFIVGGEAILGDPETNPLAQAAFARASLVGWLFQVCYHWLWNSLGWSPGKRVFGLRVVTLEGRAPGAGRGFARTAGTLLSLTVFFVGYLWAAWDRRSQTWHDRIAGTYVVKIEES